jgi:hypothetical protein
MEDKSKKSSLLGEILVRRWLVIVNAILLVYGIATTFRDAFPQEVQDKYQLHLLLPHWPWQGWVAIFAVANFFVALRGAYLAVSKREAKLREVEDAKPEIELKQPNAIHVVATNFSLKAEDNSIVWRTLPFLKVNFWNDPEDSNPSRIAKDVRAFIDYYRMPDDAPFLSIEGRWAQSDQPPLISPLASKAYLLPTDFGIGEMKTLDIAFCDASTGEYFAWNNDNYDYPDFRYLKHLLQGDRFQVTIRLRGEWIDRRLSFNFRAENNGFAIEQDSCNFSRAEKRQ